MGPQALSRIRRVLRDAASAVIVVVGGGGVGKEGVTRLMSCLARRMLQPPVRWL